MRAFIFFFVTVQEHRAKPSDARSVLAGRREFWTRPSEKTNLAGGPIISKFLDSYKKNYKIVVVENRNAVKKIKKNLCRPCKDRGARVVLNFKNAVAPRS